MNRLLSTDIVVRLNADRGVIELLVQPRAGDGEELSLLHEISMPIDADSETVEEQIGIAVLAFFSTRFASKNFGLEKYRQAAQIEAGGGVLAGGVSHHGAASADEEYEAALCLVASFDEAWDTAQLEDITLLLRRAASNGSSAAQLYLQTKWPALRAIFERRIQRKSI